MKKYFALIIITPLIMMLFSCKSQQNIVNLSKENKQEKPKEIKQEKSKEEIILEGISIVPSEFKTLSSKLSIEYDGNTFSGTMRMVKDSAIWLSLGKFGIEGVRVLLTKDSVMMLNKLNREYFLGGYEFIYDILGFGLSYNMLQSIILGKDFQNYGINDVKYSKQYNLIVFEFEKRQSHQNTQNFPQLKQKIYIDTTLNVINRNYFELFNSKQKMDIYYSTYLPFNKIKLPQTINVLMYSNKTYKVNLKFEKQKLNDNLEIPFSIPKTYSRMTL